MKKKLHLLCLLLFTFLFTTTTYSQVTFNELVSGPSLSGTLDLNGGREFAISPDGKHVYVATISSDGITIFDRNTTTGDLTYNSEIVLGAAGTNLNNPSSIEISPDGNYVYVGADPALNVFSRNSTTGALTIEQLLEDSNDASGTIPLLDDIRRLEISPDGTLLAVSGFADDGLTFFTISSTDGTLTFLEDFIGTDAPAAETSTSGNADVTNLDAPEGIAFSPDGLFVYVAAKNNDAILTFSRNPTTNDIAFVSDISNTQTNGVDDLIISSDNKFLYAAAFAYDGISWYTRNESTGALTLAGSIQDDGVDANGSLDLEGVEELVFSTDEAFVYTSSVSGSPSDALTVYSRNTSTGALTQVDLEQGDGSSFGLDNNDDMIISPDGKNVYTLSNSDDSIGIWDVDTTDGTPEIDLSQSSSIANGGTFDFGTVGTLSNSDLTFTITNSGTSELNVYRTALASTTHFSIETALGSNDVASGGGTTTFVVRFTPLIGGLHSTTLTIPNNDADESVYQITVQGTGGTVDTTPPSISSVSLAADNSYIDVTFDEGVFNTGAGSGALEASDFALSTTGGSATSPSVSSVTTTGGAGLSGGETTIRVNFTTTGTPDGGETLEVDITDGSSIFDAAGNAADANQTANNTAALNDQTAPSISSVSLAADNSYIDVTFNEGVFNTGAGSGALEASDFALSTTGGSATSPTVTSVTTTGGGALSGGETTIRINFTTTGTPDGAETLEVDITDGSSIFDAAGNGAAANQTSNNTASMNDQTAPSISSVSLASDNSYVDVTFNEGVFNTGGGSGALETGDFILSTTGGVANSPNVTSVTTTGGAALSGGETTIRVNFSVSGTADGTEELEVDLGANAVFDAAGNAAAADQSGSNTVMLNSAGPVFSTSATQSVAEGNTAVVTLAATGTGTISYSIVGGADQGDFSIIGADLSFASAPDFEAPADDDTNNEYIVQVRATDDTGTADLTITVSVTDENDSSPVFSTSATQSVAEGNTAVVTLASTDADAGASVSYSIVGGADQADFSLAGADLSFASAPDFEAPADDDTNNEYVVQVQADDGVNQTNLTITVSVTDENDNSPVFTTSATQSVAEGNTAIVTLASTDADAGASVSYSIVGGADQADFSLAGADLSFASAPDFEAPGDDDTNNEYVVQVQADDGVNQTNLTITVSVTDENDNSPVFTTSATQSVAEGNTAIVTLASTDADAGASVSYSIVGGADQADFSLAGADLSFASAPDFESPADDDTNNQYVVQVQANDGVNTTNLTITVSVTDENDNSPVFTTSATQSVAEGNTAVVTLASTDADAGASVSYSIVGGADQADFSLAGADLSFASAPDFEAPADDDTNNEYVVQVQADDGVNQTNLTITVSVTDENDNSPVFTTSATQSVAEGNTAVVTLASTDADTGASVSYSIVGGADQADFSLAGADLSFASAPDFESPGDSDTDNDYIVQVQADDGVNQTNLTITVSVTDENDNSPVFTTSAAQSIAEGNTAVVTLASTDADAGASVSYSIVGGADQADFSLAGADLSFASAPDFEAPADDDTDNQYIVQVQADDGVNQTNLTITVTVTDENDSSPVFTTIATQSVAEGNTAVVTLASTDADAGASVSYSIVGGADQADFSLAGADLSFASAPDFEAPADDNTDNQYIVQVQADDGVNQTNLTITVSVTDENDNSPVFTTSATQSIPENSTSVTTLMATDADISSTVSYSIIGGADQALFSLAGSDLSFASAPDFEAPGDANGDNDYEVQVQANDGVNQTNLTITVSVTDENDNSPVFTTSATQSIAEGNTAVVTLASTDADAGASVSYSIVGGADQADFSLAGADLSFASAPDFEAPGDDDTNNEYVVQVQADDGVNQTNLTITVSVTDENDNSPVFTTSATQSIPENSTSVTTLMATDADISSTVSYSIIGGADQALFSLAGADLSFASAPDFEAPGDANGDNDYEVQVQATDGLNTTDVTIVVSVTDVDEIPPTVTVSTTSSSPTNSTFTVTFTFSEPVMGWDLTDINVTNGTASIFNQIDATTFTALITPTTDGDVTVNVLAGTLTDLVGNPNTASNDVVITYDVTRPTLDITTNAPADPTNLNPFQATFTFSETVLSIDAGDLTLVNATVDNFTMVSTTVYTMDVLPIADGLVTIGLDEDVTEDNAQNSNEAASFSITYDGTNPTVVVSSTAADPTAGDFDVTITFSEDVTGFDMADITVSNGSASNFNTVSATEYTATITPATDGTVSVSVAADVAQDVATNGNLASNLFEILFDGTRPTVVITTDAPDPTNTSFTATFTFSEDVTGFEMADLDVENGTPSAFSGSGSVYTATITPDDDGTVTIDVAEDVVQDAATNGNEAADQYSVEYDATRPTVEVTSTAADPINGAFDVTITFDEDVTGFEMADLLVSNGTPSNFAGSGSVYTATITPTADGTVTVEVPENVSEDAATNGNESSDVFAIEFDGTRPVPTIASSAPDPTNAAFDITITFTEDVTGFEMADLTVGNGTPSNFAGSGSVYTATITPTADGTVTVEVPENVSEDAATNGNEVSNQLSREYDATNPTPVISSTAPVPVNIAFTVDMVFDENVFGFEMADLVVTNGTPSSFAGSGTTYSVLITPDGAGDVTVEIPAAVAEDLATNPNNGATFTIEYDDIPPTPPLITHISEYTCAGNAMMTGDNTLEISGAAERESVVEVFIDGISIGTTVSDVDNGFFTFDYTGTVLADGTYTFTAQATDIAMNTSALSAGFSITINTVDSDGDGNPDFCDEDDNGNGSVDVEEDCDGDGIVNSQDTDNSSCAAPIMQTRTYGFSPNGDGINEGWVIENITAFPNNTVSLYSRSGKLVFRQQNYQNDFEGVSNQLSGNGLGTKLPVGPYVYLIDLGDGSTPVRGWLYVNY